MARAYDNDLRRKYLEAYDRGEGSLGDLALRFGVSRGWGWKVSAARRRTAQTERVVGRRGRPGRITPGLLIRLRSWVEAQPDSTLAELQEKLLAEPVRLSMGRLWQVLRSLDPRRKKSLHATEREVQSPKSTVSGVRSSSIRSAPLRRTA